MPDDLPTWFSADWLTNQPLEARYTTWWNAKNSDRPGAAALVKAIEKSGLAYTPRGYLTLDDPRVIRMHDIINTPESERLAIEAVEIGKPALAGIEHLIRDALKGDYCAENGTTHTAGYFVAEVVRRRGYVDAGQKTMPPGSVAKSARFFKRRA